MNQSTKERGVASSVFGSETVVRPAGPDGSLLDESSGHEFAKICVRLCASVANDRSSQFVLLCRGREH
jgi:hypothetical protein